MAKLYMLLAGCRPKGRNTEQHDVFFTIGNNIKEIIPAVVAYWPEGAKTLHIDAWRIVSNVNGFKVEVSTERPATNDAQLFFINLGGYKAGEFEEFHYKVIVAAANKQDAIIQAKQTAFFRHTGFKGAPSHIDDKYGVDVDDVYEIKDILPKAVKEKYHLSIQKQQSLVEDEIHLGYFRLDAVDKGSGNN